jgi:hypothetical protein
VLGAVIEPDACVGHGLVELHVVAERCTYNIGEYSIA